MKTSVILTCGIAALLLTVNANAYSPIAPGDLVVYRVGDGSAALSSTTSVVFLDEYTQSGTLVQSIAMPTVSSGDRVHCSPKATRLRKGCSRFQQTAVF